MKQLLSICSIAAALLLTNCKKEDSTPVVDCFPNEATTRQLIDQVVFVSLANGRGYLIEQNAIDSRLKPCNLPDSLAIQDLPVIVTGVVKAREQSPGAPCCTLNFVITTIRRR